MGLWGTTGLFSRETYRECRGSNKENNLLGVLKQGVQDEVRQLGTVITTREAPY